MNLPNKISLTRIFLIPVFIAFFYLTCIPYNYVWAGLIFVIAACTDFIDGYIARKYNLVTDLGKFLDAIADKVLVMTALTLIISVNGILINNIVGGIGVALILAREFIVSFFRMIAASKSTVIAADKWGKIKTTIQDVCIVILLIGYNFFNLCGFSKALRITGFVLFCVAVVITIISGIEMFIKNKCVLKEKKNNE